MMMFVPAWLKLWRKRERHRVSSSSLVDCGASSRNPGLVNFQIPWCRQSVRPSQLHHHQVDQQVAIVIGILTLVTLELGSTRTTVCMYVCDYACMRLCNDVFMCICMPTCMHVCMYVTMRVCGYACLHICVYVCVCACTCRYVCMYMCVCMLVCMYVRTYVSFRDVQDRLNIRVV